MPKIKIDCKDLAKKTLENLKWRITCVRDREGLEAPKLIIYANGTEAGSAYVRNKIKACEEVGIDCEVIPLPEYPYQVIDDVARASWEWDDYPSVIVQMPAWDNGKGIDYLKLNLLREADADGITYDALVMPATARGIMTWLESNDLIPDGTTVCVLGRSDLVGMPVLTDLLRNRNVNVISLNSHTTDEDRHRLCKQADVVICAVGKPGFLTKQDIKEGAVVVDVGINKTPEGLRGDVATEVQEIATVTPVPGGVGPLTVAMLLQNVVDLWEYNGYTNCTIEGDE